MEIKTKITRQELYEMVWKESLTALSKRFSIRYSDLRKICIEMKVPVPQNGHWSKLRFGKHVTIFDLPTDYDGANEVVLHPSYGSSRTRTGSSNTISSIEDEITKDKSLPLKVPKRLKNPDPLIIAAQKSLESKSQGWRNNRGMVCTAAYGEIKIRISPASVNRALRLLDILIKLIRARGHKVVNEYSRVMATVDGEDFELKLTEKTKLVSKGTGWWDSKFKATGLFSFTAGRYGGRTWNDGKTKIEDKLAEILSTLENIATEEKARHVIWEQQEQIRKEKERIIREQQQRIEKERSDFKDLYQDAKRWERARFMRSYLKAYEQNAIQKGGLTDEVERRLCWARDKVDWYDPFMNKEDVLLNDFDKNKLV